MRCRGLSAFGEVLTRRMMAATGHFAFFPRLPERSKALRRSLRNHYSDVVLGAAPEDAAAQGEAHRTDRGPSESARATSCARRDRSRSGGWPRHNPAFASETPVRRLGSAIVVVFPLAVIGFAHALPQVVVIASIAAFYGAANGMITMVRGLAAPEMVTLEAYGAVARRADESGRPIPTCCCCPA